MMWKCHSVMDLKVACWDCDLSSRLVRRCSHPRSDSVRGCFMSEGSLLLLHQPIDVSVSLLKASAEKKRLK